jgi:hypothetical protein
MQREIERRQTDQRREKGQLREGLPLLIEPLANCRQDALLESIANTLAGRGDST